MKLSVEVTKKQLSALEVALKISIDYPVEDFAKTQDEHDVLLEALEAVREAKPTLTAREAKVVAEAATFFLDGAGGVMFSEAKMKAARSAVKKLEG
jgi:hypothetical protein